MDEHQPIENIILDFFKINHTQTKTVPDNDQSLFNSDILDSLNFILYITFLEERFQVTIDMSNITIQQFETVAQTAKTIRQLLKTSKAARTSL